MNTNNAHQTHIANRTMLESVPKQIRLRASPILLVSVLLLSACSGSGSDDGPVPVEDIGVNTGDQQTIQTDTSADPTLVIEPLADQPAVAGFTRVTFDITVPVYVSNALQVRVNWGDKDLTGTWLTDESWSVAADFPVNTENRLTVTFSDDNGAITLGTYETDFSTEDSSSEIYQITADQFDIHSWDDDEDGISNLEELAEGSDNAPVNPTSDSAEPLLSVTAGVELIADKTFRVRWEPSAAADHYRVLENPDGVSGYEDISGRLNSSATFYDHRVALHKRMNARYMVEACNTSGCTLSVQQLIEGSLVPAIGYVKASNTGESDHFGSAVDVSADGNTLVIGAPFEGSAANGINGDQADNTAAGAGAAYIYTRQDGTWKLQAYLKASNPDAPDEFGTALELSADGNTLAISAPSEQSASTGVNGDQNDNSVPAEGAREGAGAIYIFVRNGDTWQQQAYLKASNTQGADFNFGHGEQFGLSLALSADGNTLAAGAPGEDSNATGINGNQNDNSEIDSGAVYVFVRSKGNWQQQAYIKPSNTNSSRFFGQSLSLSEDGNTLVAGVNDAVTPNSNSFIARGASREYFYGAVYVFVRSSGVWETESFLRPEDAPWDDFGDQVSLAADGNRVAISARGVVYIFDRINGKWMQQGFVEPSNGTSSTDVGNLNYTPGTGYAWTISLSANGNTMAVGAPVEPGASTGLQGYQGFETVTEGSGAVYTYELIDGTWQQQAYVKASNSSEYIRFGTAIALSADGDTMAVGANQEGGQSTGINGNQQYETYSPFGAVYLY